MRPASAVAVLALLASVAPLVAACAQTVAIPPPLPAPAPSDAALYPNVADADDAGVDASDADVGPDASDASDTSAASASVVSGGLSADQIRFVVKYRLAGVRACYERVASKRAAPAGELTVSWQIGLTGAVTDASIVDVQSALDIPELKTCILQQVRSWQFPSGDKATIVSSWPFRFGVQRPR